MGGTVTYERAPGQGSCFSFQVKLGAMNQSFSLSE
jgi:signal transduction histidine kinase